MTAVRVTVTLALLVLVWLCRRRRLLGRLTTLLAGFGLHRLWRGRSGSVAVDVAYLSMVGRPRRLSR